MEARNIVSINDIREAYQKLKTYIYNDSFNLRLRTKLALFERDNNLEDRFNILLQHIMDNNIESYLSSVSTYILPKKVESVSEKSNIIVRNDTCGLSKTIILDDECYNFYIDADVEVYLLDVLWIMKEGYLLIDSQIQRDCYGNSLVFDTIGDPLKIKTGHYLFERYFDKYQKWRDNGIKIAREQTQHGNDVMLVCLDIQRFYPTSQIDFSKLSASLCNNNANVYLTPLLEQVYNRYKNILLEFNNNESPLPQLPIGLLSSGVIANWYLADFDKEMKERFNPIYYGRYVDDIFMVLGNVKPDTESKWFKEKFLYGEDSPLIPAQDDKNYILRTHENLLINSKKLKIFYFAPNHSLAILDNFQKRLDENSSAFWFLPEDDDENETLNSRGFDIIYEDTINKFREISGIKNSKYGVSIFLSKQIKKEIICHDGDNSKIKQELFKYFIEDRLIEMYSLWEKVFTYFVITEDKHSIKRLETNIHRKIRQIIIKGSEIKTKIIRASLEDHCAYCKIMAMSLNYNMIDPLDSDVISMSKKLRTTYLIRQHYTPIPIIIYTDFNCNNIVSTKIFEELLKSDTLRIKKVPLYIHPRKIHTHEICLLELFNSINHPTTHTCQNVVESSISTLKQYQLYSKEVLNEEEHTNLKQNGKKIVDIRKIQFTSNKEVSKGSIKVALSNIKIDKDDIKCAIKGSPNIDVKKRQRHYHLINLAIQEQVDCLVLPEISIPKELLLTYAEHARRKQQLIIGGLEHIVSNDICYNISVAFIPYVHNGNKEVFILPRIKNHYSPKEVTEILKYNKQLPNFEQALYHLINWKNIQFTIFNCYELADVTHRSLFRSNIDILFAIEYNKDTYYYSNIVESTCRDIHCYFIQANTSDYGDSRLSMPKHNVEMTPVKIKGGDNDTIITFTVDITKLREFQMQNQLFQGKDDFKNTPPGFDHQRVLDRVYDK